MLPNPYRIFIYFYSKTYFRNSSLFFSLSSVPSYTKSNFLMSPLGSAMKLRKYFTSSSLWLIHLPTQGILSVYVSRILTGYLFPDSYSLIQGNIFIFTMYKYTQLIRNVLEEESWGQVIWTFYFQFSRGWLNIDLQMASPRLTHRFI